MSAASIAEVTRSLTAPGELFEVETTEVRGIETRWWKHFPTTLPALLQLSRAHTALDYLVYEDERLTYEQTFARVATFAEYLRDRCGVKKGDRVALAMRN
ncbi:MAG TPA: AMP-binding protein, partial [Polyangiales bacterium]|nr:AMP-binding protein [Polyangiales bacterium]